MWIINFYQFYGAVVCGVCFYFFVLPDLWLAVAVTITVRICWFIVEWKWHRLQIQKDFTRHIAEFRQLYGPYGIRIANKAEHDWGTKQSLAEVFTGNTKQLVKTVETLEMMDVLFKAGMRPEGDEFLLHDLKLKYGKKKVDTLQKRVTSSEPREQ